MIALYWRHVCLFVCLFLQSLCARWIASAKARAKTVFGNLNSNYISSPLKVWTIWILYTDFLYLRLGGSREIGTTLTWPYAWLLTRSLQAIVFPASVPNPVAMSTRAKVRNTKFHMFTWLRRPARDCIVWKDPPSESWSWPIITTPPPLITAPLLNSDFAFFMVPSI